MNVSYIYLLGDVYVGMWKRNNKHGKGMFVQKLATTEEKFLKRGIWHENEYEGPDLDEK